MALRKTGNHGSGGLAFQSGANSPLVSTCKRNGSGSTLPTRATARPAAAANSGSACAATQRAPSASASSSSAENIIAGSRNPGRRR